MTDDLLSVLRVLYRLKGSGYYVFGPYTAEDLK